MTTPAGWYPAGEPGNERYWDGAAWTDQIRSPVAPPPPAPVSAAQGAGKQPWYRRTWIIAVAALLVGIGIGSAGASGSDDPQSAGLSDTQRDEPKDEPDPVDEPVAEPVPEPVAFELKPGHLKFTVKTREKDCFGSAGCIVVFQIDPSFEYPVSADQLAGRTWDITYEVRGGEDGPQINTMRLEDGTFAFDEDENLTTPSSSTVLAAVVTAVDEVDY